jgi:hypothetical protein
MNWAPTAQAQGAGQPVDAGGFATGQISHVGALESGGTRLADGEVSWSAASVDADSDGLKGAQLNEVNRIFQPDKNGKLSYARGSGLEIGLGTTPADENQIIVAGKAEAVAGPPSKDTKEIAVEGADPLAYASLTRGQAVANINESGLVPDICVLGDDISRGVGFASDVQLLDAAGDTQSPRLDGAVVALDDQDPDRAVSQSTSHMKLVPTGIINNYGLMAEERQTIAPITLGQMDDNDPKTALRGVTIEVLGEWVLRVVATGHAGGASVFYGPGKVSPQTPILRIIDSDNAVSDILSFQDLFGDEGFNDIRIPGLLELSIGEDPRAIAKPGSIPDPDSKPTLEAVKGTSASAAVDVVRVKLLSQPDPEAADIRFGHMEVSTHVPVGGINCPIPVTKDADPKLIKIGDQPDTSKITITVHNVYDCDLQDVVLTDHITQTKNTKPNFKLTTADPNTDSPSLPTGVLESADVVWSLGTIKKGESSTVHLDLQSASEGGYLLDIAEAIGKFTNCTGSDVAGLAITGLEVSGQSVPVEILVEIPVTGPGATRTAATGGGLAVGAAALGLVLRRRYPRRV